MFKAGELDRAKEIIDSLVQIAPPRNRKYAPVSFGQKLDRLSGLIDALRYHIGFPEESDPLKVFRPNAAFADPSVGRILFIDDGSEVESRDDQAASKLTMPLLDYLFTHPSGGRAVLSTIRGFVRAYLPQCRMIDFARTATGVLRIETNTRFAARQLRRTGLLQYTNAEAFKTWRLSLLGILVADDFSSSTRIKPEKPPRSGWEHMVFRRLDSIGTLEGRVNRLERSVKAATLDQKVRNDFLKKTMRLFTDYFEILRGITSDSSPLEKLTAASRVNELLRALSNSPEAAAVVDAFDSPLEGQRRLL